MLHFVAPFLYNLFKILKMHTTIDMLCFDLVGFYFKHSDNPKNAC